MISVEIRLICMKKEVINKKKRSDFHEILVILSGGASSSSEDSADDDEDEDTDNSRPATPVDDTVKVGFSSNIFYSKEMDWVG